MVSMCTGLLGEEGPVSTSVDTRLKVCMSTPVCVPFTFYIGGTLALAQVRRKLYT